MSRKTKFKKIVKQYWMYALAFIAVFALVFAGSRDKTLSGDDPATLASIASNNFNVSADQVSEFYYVAELANSMELSSRNEITNNFISVSLLAQNGQSVDESSSKIAKPTIVDVSHLSRGVESYTVKEGETMEAIASRYGVTTDQVRWSNNLKTTEISAGQQIYIPTVSGIAYSVKEGETVASISQKYGASATEIISYNDLETNQTLTAGTVILLPGGTLPETERPEYVAPAPAPTPTYTYTYSNNSYLGSTGSRNNMRVVERWTYAGSLIDSGNRNTPGQCTWYAWYYRKHFTSSPLPSAILGNANAWAYTLSRYGFKVDRTPSAGAVFQTTSGYYGHVGVVTAVNGDGSITVREMNYGYQAYVVTESTIPAQYVGMYNYIH